MLCSLGGAGGGKGTGGGAVVKTATAALRTFLPSAAAGSHGATVASPVMMLSAAPAWVAHRTSPPKQPRPPVGHFVTVALPVFGL